MTLGRTRGRRRWPCFVRGLLVAGLIAGLQTAVAEGQRRRRSPTEAGIRGGWDFSIGDPMAGVQLRIPVARGSSLIPSGDWIFSGGTNFQLNLDLALPLMPGGGFYAGGGAGLRFIDKPTGSGLDNEFGGNLMVGLAPYKSGRKGLHWFLEARWFIRKGTNPFYLVVGLNK